MDPVSRRTFLKYSAAATLSGGFVVACSNSSSRQTTFITPDDPEVAAYEESLSGQKTLVSTTVRAQPETVDLGGPIAQTWGYTNAAVGPEIRLRAGDRLRAEVVNGIPEGTTIHWHGVALRNNMDGVPVLTQPEIPSQTSFVYDAVMPDPGTYWYHSHAGLQLDRGMSGPLIIEDPNETLQYDHEWIIFLKDWVDGIDGATPEVVLKELQGGMGAMGSSGGMTDKYVLMNGTSALLGGDAGDVKYPFYLLNGTVANDPAQFSAKPGDRVRLRIVNAGADTAFRVALGGHRMTVTHTDGFPVEQVEADALLLGMGERYDALVTLGDGVFPLIALAEGKNARCVGIVRTGGGEAPPADVAIPELDGAIPMAWDMKAAPGAVLPAREPDRTLDIRLTGSMSPYAWTIDGNPFDPNDVASNRFGVKSGERVRLEWHNETDMWHPMHLHGHTFELADSGPRKDTVIVMPKTTVVLDFDADNPGRWAFHCHNSFHQAQGMMGSVTYEI